MVRVLREREFRLLWLGQSASTIGDRLVFVALALYVTEIGTPTDVGIVLAAHAVPARRVRAARRRLGRPPAAPPGDGGHRPDPRGAHALLAALIFTGAVEIWHIVAIEAVFGAAEAFFRPAYTGLMPQTVPEDLLQEANAATALVNTVAEFAGPALATALVLGVGAGWAFALDAATFLVSAALPDPRAAAPARRGAGAGLAARRAARGLGGVPRPHVGVGHRRDLQLPADLRARAVLRARARRSPRTSTARAGSTACWPPRSARGRSPAR